MTARRDWYLSAAVAIGTSALMALLLVVRPVPLPDWLPGATRGRSTASRPAENAPALTVYAGDQQLTVSWLSYGGNDYTVQVTPYSGGSPVPCGQVTSLQGFSYQCRFTGLTNGLRYHVSFQRADTKLPVRVVSAIPRPAILGTNGTRLWLDASDYQAITTADGTPAVIGSQVAWVQDESPFKHRLTAPDAQRRPTLGQLGALPALKLTGAQSLTMGTRDLPTGKKPSTVFAVAVLDDSLPARSCFRNLVGWGVAQTGAGRVLHKGCQVPFAFAETYQTFNRQAPTQIWSSGQPAVVTALFRPRDVALRMNGATSYDWQAPADLSMNTSTDGTLTLGAAPWDLNAGWLGRIGEFIIIDHALDDAQVKAIENYLSTKWQLTLAT
jgi:hypothetical protein